MKIVVDANVFVSAAITRGAPYDLITGWLRGAEYEILLCPTLINEIESVLVTRDSVRRYIPRDLAEAFVITIATFGHCLPDPQDSTAVLRDHHDDYLIHFARENRADLIVSGDRDLLEWDGQNPRIITPRELLALVDEGQG